MTRSLQLLRFYYEPIGTIHPRLERSSVTLAILPVACGASPQVSGGPDGYRPRSSSGSAASRRNVPERPPVFSQRAMSPMVMLRSADLHMS